MVQTNGPVPSLYHHIFGHLNFVELVWGVDIIALGRDDWHYDEIRTVGDWNFGLTVVDVGGG